jgi:hypothetical protein
MLAGISFPAAIATGNSDNAVAQRLKYRCYFATLIAA